MYYANNENKKIYAQKISWHYGRKSLPNREKLIGNYFYPGNSDVYPGSCNNAVVKILIIEVPCETNFNIYLIVLAVADMAIYV